MAVFYQFLAPRLLSFGRSRIGTFPNKMAILVTTRQDKLLDLALHTAYTLWNIYVTA